MRIVRYWMNARISTTLDRIPFYLEEIWKSRVSCYSHFSLAVDVSDEPRVL
ncbi:MAG: hypothetical protein G01um101472_153 [Parcubacteria group bacterium Gr01-1014_72]|nr:MAG: hypothetical protein G01um101472_153 [Parcubacteria group bacterium Gr01-1014_72]